MNVRWKDISLQSKVIIVCGFIVIFMTVAIFGYIMPSVKDSIVQARKGNLETIVDMTIRGIDIIYTEHTEGKITKEEAEKRASDYVRKIRYGKDGKDYLWINDFTPVVIMHPYTTSLEGKNVGKMLDKSGKNFFAEMVDVCTKKGSGYVSYMWQWKDQKDVIEPKISYVKAYKPLGWIVGTGLYVKEVEEQVADELFMIYIKLIGTLILLIAGITLVIFLFTRTIRIQIAQCVAVTKHLADGDFTKRIGITAKDEVGTLSMAIDHSIDNLESLILEVVNMSNSLAAALEAIAKGNNDLSSRTANQASALEEIDATLKETTAGVRANTASSAQASAMSEQSSATAESGGKIVVEAMNAIHNVNAFSHRIEEIISVINEISFQTNLLALNAAVEAARAGEQGRGFAVVAGEVRNLAQRSGTAAKEIGTLINESLSHVDSATALADKSSKALLEIQSSVQNVSSLFSVIAQASKDQETGLNQISTAISEMNALTQHNAALVEQTASAGEEIASQAQMMLALVEKFKVRTTLK